MSTELTKPVKFVVEMAKCYPDSYPAINPEKKQVRLLTGNRFRKQIEKDAAERGLKLVCAQNTEGPHGELQIDVSEGTTGVTAPAPVTPVTSVTPPKPLLPPTEVKPS